VAKPPELPYSSLEPTSADAKHATDYNYLLANGVRSALIRNQRRLLREFLFS
jgi:hypothetical protein